MTHCLIICTGNICRSQLAGGYVRALVDKHGLSGTTIETAGIAGEIKMVIPAGVSEVAEYFGFEVMPGKGQQVNRAMLERADIIIVMEFMQASFLLDLEPTTLPRIKIIGAYDPEKSINKEIKDPGKFDFASCLATFQEMKPALDGFFEKELLQQSSPGRLTEGANNEVQQKDGHGPQRDSSQFFEFHFDD